MPWVQLIYVQWLSHRGAGEWHTGHRSTVKCKSAFERLDPLCLLRNTSAMGQGRNQGLDGLRGLAALVVIFYHSILVNAHLLKDVLPATVQTLPWSDIVAKVVLAIVSGANAVLVFFVLSGFVLKLSFDKMFGSMAVVSANFVVRRLCRLFPAMFFAMAFLFVLSHLCFWLGSDLPPFKAGSNTELVLQNAFLLRITVHGATWTIQAELIAIPFLLIAFALSRVGGLWASFGCFVYALFAMRHPALLGGVKWMPQFFSAFMAGMVAADDRLKPVFAAVPRSAPIIIVAALVSIKLLFHVNGLAVRVSNVLLCMLLVGSVYHASTTAPFVRMLNSSAVQFFGRISYSLYLVNVPVIWVFMALTPALRLDQLGGLGCGLVVGFLVVVCSLPIAALSEWSMERGGVRIGRLLSIKPRQSMILRPAE